jgi:hypothetical protein
MAAGITRRQALQLGAAFTGAWLLRGIAAEAQHETWSVIVPPFMRGRISEAQITYLNETIPALYAGNRKVLLPLLEMLPAAIVLDTTTEMLIAHGDVTLAPEIMGEEALTLTEAQYLLTTTRFGSVATPHRGEDPVNFGRLLYIKQHPVTGYRTPPHLLLEELIHIQQDITVMRHIIYQDQLDAEDCLHGQLKGISELGAHYITDPLVGEPDYIFVLDDATHCDSAAHAVEMLAERLGTTPVTLAQALLYDVPAYHMLDAVATAQYERHIWEMVTTWRHARDAEGEVIGIAPAFQPYEADAS